MRVAWVLLVGACSYTPPGTGVPNTEPDATNTPGPDSPPAPDASVVTVDGTPGAPWLAGFTYRRRIVITRSVGTTTVQDFPVAILIANDPLLAQHARSDGGDIVVTSDDSLTLLDSELASYTSADGTAEIWVRVPTLPVGATELYLYYGGPQTPTNPTGVWGAQWKAVWHLSEPVGSAAALDSTVGAHAVAPATQAATPGHVPGVAGLARTHDGVDDRLELADPVDGSLDVGTQSFSVSLWVHATANVIAFDQPFYKGGTSSSNPGYCIMLGTGDWSAKFHDGSNFIDATFSTSPMLNQTVHLVAVVDRSTNTYLAYANGALASSVTVSLSDFDTAQDIRIGRGSGGAAFQGMTDEVRIANSALTADWIATEHANLTQSGFVMIELETQQ